MDEDVACGADDVTTPGDGQAWQKLFLDGSGTYEVQWDTAAAVTPMGALVYFAQYLSAGGVLGRLCADCPLTYHSGNAPKRRDVIGTVVLAVLNGQTRYAHINTLRQDRVSAQVLNLKKVVSEDSVRRAFGRGAPEAWDVWLQRHERMVWEPLLSEPYVLDLDNTVKPLYGHQEGAELGYNPKQPGRPSHNYHTYFVGSLRLVLGVEVHGGKQHAGRHSTPGLWKLLDGLPPACRPQLLCGDVSYGSEQTMLEAEGRRQGYLFKLRQTTTVRAAIEGLERTADAWNDVGEGWQGTELALKLMGWTRTRRCVFLRRPAQRPADQRSLPPSTEFDFVQVLEPGPCYEYIVLVSNTAHPILALTSTHAMAARIQAVLSRIGEFFNRLKRAAEQLSPEAIWAVILSVAFRVWLKGKALHPVAEGPQMLLWLRT